MTARTRTSLCFLTLLVAAAAVTLPAQVAPRLGPTNHPPLPGHPSLYWLLPDLSNARTAAARSDDGVARLARGAKLIASEQYTSGLPLVTGAAANTAVAPYAQFYAARALAGLNRLAEADTSLTALMARLPEGALRELVPMELADVALERGDARRAVDLLDDLSDEKLTAPEEVWLRLGRAAEAAADPAKALAAYRRVYYDYPLSAQAVDAQAAIARIETPALQAPDRFKQELARAERLFTARRWAQARAAFEPLSRAATAADDRELIALRVAEADYYLDRFRAARDGVRPYIDSGSRKAEARFFYLTATRALGDRPAYVTLARQLIADFPGSSWTEEALNNLASHYIIENEDDEADRVFREVARQFPQGRYAERAAWRIGWRAYKAGNFAEAVQVFEDAATRFPRADTRPAWLYWAGRGRDQMGDAATANLRYRLTSTDYLNSYYGRLSSKLLIDRREGPVPESVRVDTQAMPSPLIPTDALIRQLVAAGLYEDAQRELVYAQRAWGNSPAVEATIAWLRHEKGLDQQAMERFLNIRGAITQMKRAYPQYLAAGGEDLPAEVLRIMFPLDYWPLIQKYAAAHKLDPYLMASLIAQESTFTADIRSAANAYGLMQLIPAAGRQYARKVGLRYSLRLLSQPEANIRMGMAYFRDLSNRFGGDHFALASYNAGPHRVARWLSERPGVAQDEFIDDIPFPETQNYVKRILGQAEDYRRLYGPGGPLTPGLRSSARR